jgi:hypothetical protein
VIQEPQAAWPDFFAHELRSPADDKALDAVFASLGRVAVHRLVSVPHPFGLPPQDRLAARRWLSRQASTRQRDRDLTILLAFVALGLALAIAALSLYPAIWPCRQARAGISDAVRKSQTSMAAIPMRD